MTNTRTAARIGAVCLGTVMLVGIAGVAAAEEQHDDGAVDVQVQIVELTEPGVLAMTVANAATTLTENGSTATERQFTGQLPTVTVTDTRTADEIPAGAGWYVIGTSSDFIGDAGQPAIGAGHLGWAPHLIDGGDAGLVAEGEVVDTVMDEDDPGAEDPFGLVDQELLALVIDSAAIAPEGQWTANADLFLRTPVTVEPGNYVSTLTLSLFE
ncbi:hypothetical protein [Agromyces aureus]|uniref:WxL domain-containing protein n=1 Tax=Agromyces aureus TaxID=453304 RepID=A0A191WJ06_9MICO|nr:hypothetical protein [Agromyces aureus]ANJ28197.1 hypothetical protein ATC03_17295 [Agromyces aureus]